MENASVNPTEAYHNPLLIAEHAPQRKSGDDVIRRSNLVLPRFW